MNGRDYVRVEAKEVQLTISISTQARVTGCTEKPPLPTGLETYTLEVAGPPLTGDTDVGGGVVLACVVGGLDDVVTTPGRTYPALRQ